MNWIKENKFLAVLCGGTLVGLILLLFIGSRGASQYATAQEEYQTAADEAAGYEKGFLYPKEVNRAAKSKALDDYRQELEELQKAYQPFRAEEITNVSPQEFTDHLIKVEKETRKAFEDNEVTVPAGYFVGFERYKTSLASKESTGILGFELAGLRNLMLSLAAAKPKELRNLYRAEIPEESGKAFEPGDAVARSFPIEITFTGSEKSAREFVTSVTKLDEKYAVIRALRISNTKKDPRVRPMPSSISLPKSPQLPRMRFPAILSCQRMILRRPPRRKVNRLQKRKLLRWSIPAASCPKS